MDTETRTLKDLVSLPIEEKAPGVELKLSEAKEQELGQYIRAAYLELKAYRTPLESEWADNEKREESVMGKSEGPWPGSSDIRPPMTRVVKDTLCALWMNSLNGDNARVRAKPIRQEDVSKSEKNEKYMNYQLDEEINWQDVTDRATQEFLGPTGNVFLEPRYVIDKEEREETILDEIPIDENNPEAGTKKARRTQTHEETIFDGVKVDVIRSEFIHAAPIWENAAEAAERDILIKILPQSVDEIRRKAKGVSPKYHNVDLLETFLSKKEPNLLQLAKWRIDRMTVNYLRARIVLNTAEAYLWWKVSGEGANAKEERVIVTLDIETGTVLRVVKGRCRMVHIKPFPVQGRFWGRSPHAIVKPIQKHLDAVTNQYVDAATIGNLPFFLYRAGGTFNPQTFPLMPAHGYPVENPQDVVWSQPPKVDNSFLQVISQSWEWIERLFGLNENIQGLQSQHVTTATEAIEVSKRSAIKFGNPFQRTVNQLKPLFYHIHDLNMQFTPPEKTFQIVGMEGIPVFARFTPDQANARLNFEFEADTVFDEQLARDTWLMAWRMFANIPQIMTQPAYFYRLTKKAMSAVIGETDAYLPVPEEAKLPSAEEAIQLLLQGEKIEPMPGIDPQHYLRVFAYFIDSEDFKDLRNDQQHALFDFFGKTKLMKAVFDKFNLNASGHPDVPPIQQAQGAAQGGPPSVVSSRQPSQKFNFMKVGEAPGSTRQNATGPGSLPLPMGVR